MELYTLDSSFRRVAVIDSFESLIWTERWADIGDFELHIASTPQNRTYFLPSVCLAVNTSFRVMTVETVEDTTDENNLAMLTVKGRSLEAFLDDRVGKANMNAIPDGGEKYRVTGTPKFIAENLFWQTCVSGTLNTNDLMPYYTQGSIFPTENIPEPPSLEIELEIGSLYEMIKSICDKYGLGFRLVREYDKSKLYFNVYTGIDRTTAQQVVTPVVFSPEFDNLQNTSDFYSIEEYKNVAYVFSPTSSLVVNADNSQTVYSGFARKAIFLLVDDPPTVNNVAPTAAAIQQNLKTKGLEELAKRKAKSVFDGELSQNSAYKYGIDYQLGDKVEIRDVDNIAMVRRVSEQIFVSDNEGERSYPTLSDV